MYGLAFSAMRAARLVQVLLLLQARGRMTARQLADELEVSSRTIYRDLEALSGAGVPVYAERGAEGGYQLLDGYRTTLTGLTAKEAEALFLSGLPGPAAELGLATAVAAARRKVLAALPAGLREAAAMAQERIHLDASGWFRTPPEHPHLEAVASAVWGCRRVSATAPPWSGSLRHSASSSKPGPGIWWQRRQASEGSTGWRGSCRPT